MSNPYDDEPYICPVCETTGGPNCRKYGGRCEPFAIIVVGEQFAPDPKRADWWDEPARCYCVTGEWFMLAPADADALVGEQPEAWGLPLVWDGAPIIPNFDRLVRLAEIGRPACSHVPVRQYDAYEAPHYADKWARALGGRVVMTGRDGGQEVTGLRELAKREAG